MKQKQLLTVVETHEFIRQATSWDTDAKEEFIQFIAQNPLAGDLIPGTEGARKIRWAPHAHKGKRGGARVIYYYYDQTIPIFLFTAYCKNQKNDITMKEKKLFHEFINQIIDTYRGYEDE